MVEQNRSGAHSQFVYSPTGFKMQVMSGQSYVTDFVPLPGGGMKVYTPSVSYYRHPDWLGSSRFASTPSRTIYYDGAYAPFGETYATSGTTDVNFTSMNSDTIPGLYDFPAREYSIEGRWPSPDPAGLAAADPSNPQSWNRYSYVTNRPMSLIDRLGLDGTDCGGAVDAASRARASFRRFGGRTRHSPRGMDDCLDSSGSGGGGGIDGGSDPGAGLNGFGPGNLPLDPNTGSDPNQGTTWISMDGTISWTNQGPVDMSNAGFDLSNVDQSSYADGVLQQLAPQVVSIAEPGINLSMAVTAPHRQRLRRFGVALVTLLHTSITGGRVLIKGTVMRRGRCNECYTQAKSVTAPGEVPILSRERKMRHANLASDLPSVRK